MRPDLDAVRDAARAFAPLATVEPSSLRIEPIGRGHINDTFRIDARADRYVIQRINATVFPDPVRVCENTMRVGEHVQRADPRAALVPLQFATTSGAACHREAAGGVWRLTGFVDGRSTDRLADLAEAEQAGWAFGRFQALLADFDATSLVPAIAGFHDLGRRLADLDDACREAGETAGDLAVRLREVRPMIEFVTSIRDEVERLDAGRKCVIHADCKVNNLIFGRAGEVAAIVDLDTVMPGARAIDFGDLVRSAAATTAEDGAESSVGIDLARFEAIARGYLRGIGDCLDDRDCAMLVTATITVTFMLGVRFLTDYLRGDRYFRIAHRRQNRDRARAQFALAAHLRAERAALERIIDSIG